MNKNEIAEEAIHLGLNLGTKVLGVDASAVIPSVVGYVLKSIGECETCKFGIEVDGPYDEIKKEYVDCNECGYNSEPEIKPKGHFCAWYEENK